MILRLRIPNKLFVCALSVTGAAVGGAVWTFHEGASAPSTVPTFVVPVPANGNHYRAKSTVDRGSSIGRGTAHGKSRRGDRYVSQMLTLAAGHTLPFRLEDRSLGFGANGVDDGVNDVQKEGKLASFEDISLNPGHLFIAAGAKVVAFAEDPSNPQGTRPPNDDGGPGHNIYPSPSVSPSRPPSSSAPPLGSAPPTRSAPPLGSAPPRGSAPPTNSAPPISSVPPTGTAPPPPTSVPDSGSTFLLMLCCGAGLIIMGKVRSPRLEK
jgi:hypothetical protein